MHTRMYTRMHMRMHAQAYVQAEAQAHSHYLRVSRRGGRVSKEPYWI